MRTRAAPLAILLLPLLAASVHAQDTAAPVLLEAVTIGDGTGAIAAVALRFNEPVDASGAVVGDFTLSGCSCGAAVLDAPAGLHDIIHVRFAPGNDTGSRPRIAYAASGSPIVDAAGNALASTSVQARDGAPPVLVFAEAKAFLAQDAVLRFSEPVRWSGNADSALTPSDLAYEDLSGDGARGISVLRHAARDGTVFVRLDAPFRPGDDGVDRIQVVDGSVADIAGNTAPAHHVVLRVDTEPPPAVRDLFAEGAGSRSITLSWTAPEADDLLRYDLRWSTQPINASTFASARHANAPAPSSGARQTITISDLDPQQHHFFAIAAVDRNGNVGPMSNVAGATTRADTTPPAAVADLAAPAEQVGATELLLTWTSPADEGSSTVARYDLRMATDGLGRDEFDQARAVPGVPRPSPPGAEQSVWVTGLQPDTQYQFAVRALDAAHNPSVLSNILAVRTAPDASLPGDAFVLRSETHKNGTATTDPFVVLTWEPMEDANGTVTYRYAVTQDADHRVGPRDHLVDEPRLEAELEGDGHWALHVAAFTATGRVQATFHVILDRVPPGAVTGLHVARLGYVDTELAWTAGEDGTSGVDHYEVRLLGGTAFPAEAWETARPVATAGATRALLALDDGTPYTVGVRAVDAAGNRGPMASVGFTTLADVTPPDGFLHIVSPSHDGGGYAPTVEVTWSGVEDPETPLSFYYAWAAARPEVDEASPSTSDDTLRLEADGPGTYTLVVRSRSAGGWGPEATLEVQVTPMPAEVLAAEHAATSVHVERQDGVNIIRWTLPPDPVLPVVGVQVWANNSVHVLVHETDDPEEVAGAVFYHDDASAQPTTRYTVLPYFGATAALGRLDEVPQTAPPGVAPDMQPGPAPQASSATWRLPAILLGAVVLAAAGAWATPTVRSRVAGILPRPWPARGPASILPEGDAADLTDGAGGAQEGETLYAADCPACGTPFQVEGTLPLVAACPHCDADVELAGDDEEWPRDPDTPDPWEDTCDACGASVQEGEAACDACGARLPLMGAMPSDAVSA